jgi:hypothetical protein
MIETLIPSHYHNKYSSRKIAAFVVVSSRAVSYYKSSALKNLIDMGELT